MTSYYSSAPLVRVPPTGSSVKRGMERRTLASSFMGGAGRTDTLRGMAMVRLWQRSVVGVVVAEFDEGSLGGISGRGV